MHQVCRPVAAIIALTSLLWTTGVASLSPLPQDSTLPAWEILQLEGQVRGSTGGNGELSRLRTGDSLVAGSWLETNVDSRVELSYGQTRFLRLDQRSRVELFARDSSNTLPNASAVRLIQGRAWVSRLGRDTGEVALITPQFTARPTGTAFTVALAPSGKARLRVYSGHVTAQGSGGWTQSVPSGQQVLVSPSGLIEELGSLPSQSDDFSDWALERDAVLEHERGLDSEESAGEKAHKSETVLPKDATDPTDGPPMPHGGTDFQEEAAQTERTAPPETVEAPVEQPPKQKIAIPTPVPAEAQEKGPAKLGFSGGLSVGAVTKDGEFLTRVSLRPEIAFGPLGVGLDVELFLDGQGNILPDGWQFGSGEEAARSLLRKIYYVRLYEPGDRFYIRAGAIENVNLDPAGLITSSWGNTALYPGSKPVGIHLQLNGWSPLNAGLDLVNNSLEDWKADHGGLIGARFSLAPLAPTGLPIFSGLQIGMTAMQDLNQLAAIEDLDEDGCPDEVDHAPKSRARCFVHISSAAIDSLGLDSAVEAAVRSANQAFESQKSDEIRGRFKRADDFALVGIDYRLPLVTSKLLNLGVYGEYAMPWDNEDPGIDSSWALVPLGVGLGISLVDATLQYQLLQGQFHPGHFDAAYDMERARFTGNRYRTKEDVYWKEAPSQGLRQGLYGKANLKLFGLAETGASYAHLFPETGASDRSYSAKVALGQSILTYIPKLNRAEMFYEKDHVGRENESFFEASRYSRYGYTVGLEMGGGLTIHLTSLTTYQLSESKLTPESNFVLETALSF